MRGYLHHIGDWAAATRHLSILECGAYHALIQAYYLSEQPLPGTVMECCRIVGARMPFEIAAVKRVMEQFFYRADDGKLHQKRCDEEIEKASARRVRQSELVSRRHQEKRLEKEVKQTLAKSDALGFSRIVDYTKNEPLGQTRPDTSRHAMEHGKVNGNTKPVLPTNNQLLNTYSEHMVQHVESVAAAAAVLLSKKGYKVEETNSQLQTLALDGAGVCHFRAAAEIAERAGKGLGYLFGVVANLVRADGGGTEAARRALAAFVEMEQGGGGLPVEKTH